MSFGCSSGWKLFRPPSAIMASCVAESSQGLLTPFATAASQRPLRIHLTLSPTLAVDPVKRTMYSTPRATVCSVLDAPGVGSPLRLRAIVGGG